MSPVDLAALIMSLRGHCPGIRNIFNSEVALALEYLDGPGSSATKPTIGRSGRSPS